MKHMKKFFALLLALSMVLAFGLTAFAADPVVSETGSITIDNAVVGKTYTIYRIFDLDDHNSDYSAMTYLVNSKWAAFFETGAVGLNYVDISTTDGKAYVTWKAGASAADFAAAAIAFATTKGAEIANDGTAEAISATVKFDNLALGYYLVQSDLGALCSLDTTMPDVTIKEKNSEPSIDKAVEEDADGSYGKTDDANIGDVVNFRTTVTVVDGAPKGYIVHDKMSEGLTFRAEDAEALTVKIGDKTLVRSTDYDLVTENLKDGCTFEIHFIDDKDEAGNATNSHALKPNDVVTIAYSAQVNENAVIAGDGNTNEAKLDYGTDGHTEWDTTRTYVWDVDVVKYTTLANGTEKMLENAEFVLYKMFKANETEDATLLYAQVDSNNTITGWSDTKENASVFKTPASGKFTITGLDSGTYYLEETKAPAGFNVLKDPVVFVIESAVDSTANTRTAAIKLGGATVSEVKVENKTGTELPSTGGIGTTIFYVIGGLLAAGAAILLVTKRRMSRS